MTAMSPTIHDELKLRRSIREFTKDPIPCGIRERLMEKAMGCRDSIVFKFVWDDESGNMFNVFRRSYGMFKNVRNYAICYTSGCDDDLIEAGYISMSLTMEAMRLGIGTCITTGSYDPSHIIPEPDSHGLKIAYVMAIGYASPKSRIINRIGFRLMHRHNMNAADLLADGTHIGSIPDNILIGIEAVASAPSAYNRHPLRFYIGDDGTFSVRSSSPLELGIAKWAYEAASGLRFPSANISPL